MEIEGTVKWVSGLKDKIIHEGYRDRPPVVETRFFCSVLVGEEELKVSVLYFADRKLPQPGDKVKFTCMKPRNGWASVTDKREWQVVSHQGTDIMGPILWLGKTKSWNDDHNDETWFTERAVGVRVGEQEVKLMVTNKGDSKLKVGDIVHVTAWDGGRDWTKVDTTKGDTLDVTGVEETIVKAKEEEKKAWVAEKTAEHKAERDERNAKAKAAEDARIAKFPEDVQGIFDKSMTSDTLIGLLRDTFWFGPISEGEGGKVCFHDPPCGCGYPGTGMRRPGGALYSTPGTIRKKLLRVVVQSGLVEKTDEVGYKATTRGLEVLKLMDIADGERVVPYQLITVVRREYGAQTYESIVFSTAKKVAAATQGQSGSNIQSAYTRLATSRDKL